MRLGSSVAEYSHGKREVLGSSPGRTTIFHHLLHLAPNVGQLTAYNGYWMWNPENVSQRSSVSKNSGRELVGVYVAGFNI